MKIAILKQEKGWNGYQVVCAYAILLAMKPATGGYTLLEVMIFLAISGLLLFVTNVVFSGQSARAEFSTSMNNVNSKMQNWIIDVQNGVTGSSSAADSHSGNYNCDIDPITSAPVLSSPQSGDDSIRGRALGTNLNCVSLGSAIVANDSGNNTAMYNFAVIGKRTYNNGSSTVLIDSLKSAAPTAGVFDTGGGPDPDISLIEEYKIPNGVRIRHSWSSTNANPSPHNPLAGFFIDPSNASNSILAVQYPMTANYDPTVWSGGSNAYSIVKCINLNLPAQDCKSDNSVPPNLWPMATWNICFESTRDDERALLEVKSISGQGASTKLTMGRGGQPCA